MIVYLSFINRCNLNVTPFPSFYNFFTSLVLGKLHSFEIKPFRSVRGHAT